MTEQGSERERLVQKNLERARSLLVGTGHQVVAEARLENERERNEELERRLYLVESRGATLRDRIEELEGDLEAAKRGADSFFERECELLRGENENLRAALLAYQKRDAKQVGEKCVCSLCYEAEKLLTGSDTLTASEASPREEQLTNEQGWVWDDLRGEYVDPKERFLDALREDAEARHADPATQQKEERDGN